MRIRGVNKLPPKLAVFFVILACSILPGCSQDPPRSSPIAPSPKTPEPTPPSLAELRAHAPTRLIRNGPSPAPSAPSQVPPGVIEVTYPSGDLELKAWLAFPDDERDAHPAVVYFHSGFALGPSDLEEARVFLDAGFAVLMPMLRGENGNPGDFELFWGEVDDAVAAVNWLAERDDISRDHIFTFGHSIGGGISAMLSLVDGDVPIRHGGSCGGLYVPKIFDQWLDIVPFDASKSEERSLRTLVGHTKSMRREHHAYLGIGDPLAESRQQIRGSKLHQQLVLGDHLSSLRPSLTDYAKLINQQVFGDSRPLPESLQPISWKHPESIPVDAVFEDSAKPEQWDVNNDPFSGELRFFRGEVRCPITIVVRETYPNQRGDFLSPRGFEPVAKLTQHPKAGGFPSGLIDLSTMLVTKNHRGAFFETLSGNLYGFNGRKGYFGVFWPGTEDTVGYPPDEMSRKVWSGVYAISPGGRYVVAITADKELVAWDASTRQIVGRSPVPTLDGMDAAYLPVSELGFAPDGKEFAAILGTPGKTWLLNWHWESGIVTECHSVVSPWGSSRSGKYPNRYQLQFLEEGRGWLVEFGRTIIDRKTGKRRRAFSGGLRTGTHARAIAGNRVIGIWQDPVSLYSHQVATFPLRFDSQSD